jgi:hypothetical protein
LIVGSRSQSFFDQVLGFEQAGRFRKGRSVTASLSANWAVCGASDPQFEWSLQDIGFGDKLVNRRFVALLHNPCCRPQKEHKGRGCINPQVPGGSSWIRGESIRQDASPSPDRRPRTLLLASVRDLELLRKGLLPLRLRTAERAEQRELLFAYAFREVLNCLAQDRSASIAAGGMLKEDRFA